MDQVRVPVVRHFQKGVTVYLGHLTAALARRLIFADHYPPAPGRTGYQRPPDEKRAQAFARHLQIDPAGFMTPVLLNARRSVRFIVSESSVDVGYLLIDDQGPCMAVVDGQHRGLGVDKFLGMNEYPVPFMLFDCLDIETEQRLFITINREQKRVSMSHVHFVGREADPLAELATRLESDPDSPWYRRVNLIGAKGTKRPVSLQSLRAALEALLQAGDIKRLPLEQQYEMAMSFWRVVGSIWQQAWEAPRNSLLTKSMGTLAVAKLGGYLLPLCLLKAGDTVMLDTDRLKSYLTRAASVNWMSDGPFEGYAGHHGADLVKNQLDALIFGSSAD